MGCSSRCSVKTIKLLKESAFLLFLLIGIISGIVIGILIKHFDPEFYKDKREVMYLGFPGDLLLRMLKCMIIPLIVTSLISGMAAIPGKASGRMGGFAVLYYLITTFMAVLLGILLVATIKPGEKGKKTADGNEDAVVQPVDSLLDLIRFFGDFIKCINIFIVIIWSYGTIDLPFTPPSHG